MKMAVVLLAGATFLLTGHVRGQSVLSAHSTAWYQAEAVSEFPALGQAGSEFNKLFIQRLHNLQFTNDSLLQRDDWPLILAKEIAIEVGSEPVSNDIAASQPSPSPTPSNPQGTAQDQNPADASALDPMAPPPKRYQIVGAVLRRSDDGLLVGCTQGQGIGYERPQGNIWLIGYDAPEGGHVDIEGVKIGTHKYTYFGQHHMADEYQASQ